jgi:hypothetical protein
MPHSREVGVLVGFVTRILTMALLMKYLIRAERGPCPASPFVPKYRCPCTHLWFLILTDVPGTLNSD